PATVERQGTGETDRGARRWPSIASGPRCPGPGDGRDDPGLGVDTPYTLIEIVRYVDVPPAVQGEAPGPVELCVSGRTAIAPIAARTGTGDGCDLAGLHNDGACTVGEQCRRTRAEVHNSHAHVAGITNIQIPIGF